ncbi:MAG: hypothetical protein WBY12_01800, partial [Hyphomicrobium sp.]
MLFADRVRAAALLGFFAAALVLMSSAAPVRAQALFESAGATVQAEVPATNPAPAATPEAALPLATSPGSPPAPATPA